MAESIAEGMGATCDFVIDDGYPFLVNDPEVTQTCWDAANEFLGEENVEALDLRMTSEDFSYYSQVMPSCFYRLGITKPIDGTVEGLHTSTFDVDESSLMTSVGLMSWLALSVLDKK